MKTIIYYFSGRGNTYYTAKKLSENLENAALCSMSKAKEIDENADIIGIATPVIDLGIPGFVQKFITTLKAVKKSPYIFAIITCGGMPAASVKQLSRSVKRSGHILSSAFVFKFGLEPLSKESFDQRIQEIASIVVHKQTVKPLKLSIKDKILTSCANPLARAIIPNEDKKFLLGSSCNGCGICIQVCPVQNIAFSGKPVWQHHCTQCAACFCWCPKQAISGTNLAAKTRYSNKHVSLQDFLKN